MAKTAAERKAAQRARQAAAGGSKFELILDTQELEMLERNCASRRPGRAPYEMSEYVAMLIRQDDARVRWQRLRLYHFPGSVLTDYRILKNYIKTIGGAV